MLTVAIFFQESGALSYPLNKEKYVRHFLQMDAAIRACGARCCIVRHQSSYSGSGHFSQSWEFQNGSVVETGPVRADVVFDKGLFVGDGRIPVLNRQEINDICTDKYKTFQWFPEDCPQTCWVATEAEFEAAIAKLQTPYKVVKPIDGLEARDVCIGTTEELKDRPRNYPLLVQEFIDSRAGIPGIVSGTHDLRLAILNGEIVHSFARVPPPGSAIASTSRGATVQIIEDWQKLPPAVFELADRVEQKMKPYGDRFYSIDLAIAASGRPQIIELNSRPSIWDDRTHPVFAETKRKLAEVLAALGNTHKESL